MHPSDSNPPRGVEEKIGEQNFRVFSEMRGKNLYYNLKKMKIWSQNGMTIQKSTLPNLKFRFWKNLDSRKIRNRHFQTQHQITILKFRAQNLISQNPKLISAIPLESHFETQKFEFSDLENPEIYCFAPKFKFFFDQNFDFVLGNFTMRTD